VTALEIPDTENGVKFTDQFFGKREAGVTDYSFPFRVEVPLKKARIMAHWSERIGAKMINEKDDNSSRSK